MQFTQQFVGQLVFGLFSLVATVWGVVKYLMTQITAARVAAEERLKALEGRLDKQLDEIETRAERELEGLRVGMHAAALDSAVRFATKEEFQSLDQRIMTSMGRLETKIDRIVELLFEHRDK